MNNGHEFPENFFIGTATSAHQVEGGNSLNDWWKFEQKEKKIEGGQKSGRAIDQYHKFREDFQLLAGRGFKAHRISIEWSRIIPKPNEVNQKEIDHYREVLTALKETGQEPYVTLHHFTSPQWFMELGGFEKRENLSHWRFWVTTVVENLGDLINIYNTINEPYIYATLGYLKGWHSPGKTSIRSFVRITENITQAHFIAVGIIRQKDPEAKVGIVKNMMDFKALRKWSPIDQLIKIFSEFPFQGSFLRKFMKKKTPIFGRKIKEGDPGDFIGVNYYIPQYCGLGIKGLSDSFDYRKARKLTQMNWEVHPKGLYNILKKVSKRVNLPIIITENGIATLDDDWRKEFIFQHLSEVQRAISEGVDVQGYFHWSAFDNFEWAEGYTPRFGLVEVDMETLERKTRGSLDYLSQIAKSGTLFPPTD